jgi:phage tail-like protein
MPATGVRDDPYAAFNFLVEIDGVTVAGFSECSGLSTESDVIEYRCGNEPATMRKLPGILKYTKIVLKRGYTTDQSLWTWRKTTLDGQTQRVSGSIVLLDEGRQEALRWNFSQGWACKWDGPAFNAKTNDVAIELIEIAHEGLVLAT